MGTLPPVVQVARTTRRTTLHLLVTTAILVGYSAMLLVAGPSGPERFPFFKWSLFSVVPDEETVDFGIRVVEVGGRPVSPPRYLEDATGLGLPTHSIDAVTLTQELGAAVTEGRIDDAEAARAILEVRFLSGPAPVRYELVRRRFDLLERRECADCFIEEEVLDEHRTG